MQSQVSLFKRLNCCRLASHHASSLLQKNFCFHQLCLEYSVLSSGTRPSSILREDISIEAVLGQNEAAAMHLKDALRDSVKERLSIVLGRQKDRPVDLESLQKLPVDELLQACRQAHLTAPLNDDPHHLVAALHRWLHAPEATAAASSSRIAGGSDIHPSGWDRPVSLRQSAWLRQTGNRAAAPTTPADRGSSIAGIGPIAPEAQGTSASVAAIADEPDEALRAEAERQADALFDEELQLRLKQAAMVAETSSRTADGLSTGMATCDPCSSSHDESFEGRSRLAVQSRTSPSPPPQVQILRPPQQQQAEPPQYDIRQQQRQPQQCLDKPASHREPLFMSTTDLLATGPRSGATAVDRAYGQADGAANVLPFRMIGGGSAAEGSLFDSPPPSSGPPQPGEVAAAVRRSLGRVGYDRFRDPASLRSLLLLSRGELLRLVESFVGCNGDTAGQSREQLADKLMGWMTLGGSDDAVSSAATAGASSSGSDGRDVVAAQHPLMGLAPASPLQPEMVVAASGGGEAAGAPDRMEPGRDRRRVVTWMRQEGIAEVWDDEKAAMGDWRRRQVLAAVRRRQQLLAAAAKPEEIASWLVKARAQDVAVISSCPDLDLNGRDVDPLLDAVASASPVGSASAFGTTPDVPCMVIATALSQRHAYACAVAVQYQIRERLEELASQLQYEPPDAAASSPSSSPSSLPLDCAPCVSGFNGADWLSLEAGLVQVHVLSPQARRYYRLEELMERTAAAAGGMGPRADRGAGRWGTRCANKTAEPRDDGGDGGEGAVGTFPAAGATGAAGMDARPSVRPHVRLFALEAMAGRGGGQLPDTLETARVDTAAAEP